ncbi:10-epi-juneol synthase isoform X1 [Lactuca sativa]|uniref:10-epi-juneol synthase isoform X1 n=1 Tax=Lactuca sativa TaxID=4236 RepID=UPI001C69023B|nr:10-epi-juneol synthase isoform X1 [Lactuca sativa]
MAANESNTTQKENSKTSTDPVRPVANFPPPIWDDRLLSLTVDYLVRELEAYAKAIDEPKEELRRLIINVNMDSNAKLCLINSVYRLGLRYMFREEIECQLDKLFKELNMEDYDQADLHTVSTNFQVFRQHGYKLSCDVFNKFKDHSSGKFKEYITADVRGMLSFYESTQLRIRGESILDEAIVFTEAHLVDVVDTLEGNLARQVRHALRSYFHRGMHIVEARLYFSNYEKECSTYDSLSKLANTHVNYLQQLHKEELRIFTEWIKDMDFKTITPYARDRTPEVYLWAIAIFPEPDYSQSRIVLAKMVQLILVLDDIYDAYGTIEELRLLTSAINSWEINVMEQLPEYIKPLYNILLNELTEVEKQLSREGRADRVYASKQAFQELAGGYLQEAEWRYHRHVPSFEEYLRNGLITSTYDVFIKSSLMVMGDIVCDKALAWYESRTNIEEAAKLLGRIYNDVTTYQFEGERAQQVESVHTYMKTFGVPENVAVNELKKMIENNWKDINEGCLKPTEVSMELLAPILNLSRMTDTIYRYNDRFTFPENTIVEYVTLLFIDSVPKY